MNYIICPFCDSDLNCEHCYGAGEIPIPHWASGFASGEYLQKGAQLSTRDGRRIGNAVVLSLCEVELPTGPIPAAEIRTDMGTLSTMTEDELRGIFYEPKWIMKLATKE